MEGIQYGMQQGYNPMTTAGYPPQASLFGQQIPFGQQGQFGQQTPFGQPGQFGQQGLFGAVNPLSGVIGSGIGGLQAGQYFGRQPGQLIDGFGGMFHGYGGGYSGVVDPLVAAQIQQAQLAQQALHAQLAQQQIAQRLQLAQHLMQPQVTPWQIANPQIANLLTRLDPVTAAYVQQAQIAQLCQQLGLQGPVGQIGQPFGLGLGPQAWLGAVQQPWVNPLLATGLSRGIPGQYGQLPIY